MQTAVAISLENLEAYLGNLLAEAMQEGHQVALWRKPKSNFLQIIIDTTGKTKRVSPQLEELPSGFIIHPFLDQEDRQAIFLKANTYFKVDLNQDWEEQKETLPPVKNQSPHTATAAVIREHFVTWKGYSEGHQPIATTKEEFVTLVKKGIAAIGTGKLNKIVPARTKIVELSEDFDLINALKKLLAAYPNAFINFFHIPGLGSWLGATPEILIQTKGTEFYTMSLAGTQKAQGDNPLKNVAWTQKEIEEQALVSRYIVDCFKKIRLREYEEHGPKTVVAGNLLHLRSDFKVDMKATNFPQLGSVMLDLLHPTSAVCGMPRREAFDFLSRHENFDRSLFAGYIGPVNVEEETSIFVNLRTARLLGNQAILFAGAGVTEDSDPEKEWEETEMKCEIIGRHLKNEKP